MTRRPGLAIRLFPALAGLLLFGAAAAAKPTAPVALVPRITATDPVAHTADIEVQAQALIEGTTISIKCGLPEGTAVVPGTGEWTRRADGRQVLRMRVTLPPASATPPGGGKLIIMAELNGPAVRTGVTAALTLPPADPDKVRPEPPPPILETTKGEKLRVHK